ncbi:MAG TPA: hypothetical protein VFX33_07995 [Actinomycetales bacterium]|nr:hypothetical protein [Actinomycetales bacterium]
MTTYEAPARQNTRLNRTALVGALTFLVAAGLPVTGILTADMRDVAVRPGLIDWIFVSGVAVLSVLTFGLLVRWLRRRPHANPARVGLVLSLIAMAASIVAFWTMVPVVLGSAAAWLGVLGRDAATRSRTSAAEATIALVVGVVAAVGSAVMYVVTS